MLLFQNKIYKHVTILHFFNVGKIESMRHLKNEVDSVKRDVECGLRFQDQSITVEIGDTVICYTTNMEVQKTDWDPGF